VNTTAAGRPTAKQIEDQAAEVHRRVRQAVDHASAGDWRRAHAEAEAAQGACRRLKELVGHGPYG
jgi:hypothetical protein